MTTIPVDYEILRLVWWLLLGVLLIGFAIMDGFDLGVAMLLPYVARTDIERRVTINAIGPVWDGNQVWLILGGGAVFAVPSRHGHVQAGHQHVVHGCPCRAAEGRVGQGGQRQLREVQPVTRSGRPAVGDQASGLPKLRLRCRSRFVARFTIQIPSRR